MKSCYFLVFTLLFTFSSVFAQQQEVNYRELGSEMPEIILKDRLEKIYTEKDITPDRNFILVLFNPTCGHCTDAADSISRNAALFEQNTVFFMSVPEMTEYLDRFAIASKFKETPHLFLGVDGADVVKDIFNYNNLPQINIYDKDKKLIKIMNGDIDMTVLKEYLY